MLKFHACIAMVIMLLPQASFAFSDGVWCGEENKHYCNCPNGEVRYGANGVFTSWRSVSSQIACNNDVFGDPLRGTGKHCYCRKNNALLIDGAPAGGSSPAEVNHPDFASSLGEVQCCHDSDGCTRRDNGVCISGNNNSLKFSFHEAVDACATLGDGWRICTRHEVDSNLCRSKGCAHDSYLVWATEKKFYPSAKVHPYAGTATCQAVLDEWCVNNTPYKHARFGRHMSNANNDDAWRCYSTGALTADRMYVRMVNPAQKCSKSGATAGVPHPDDATCWNHWTRQDDLSAIVQSCLDATIEMVNGFIKAEGVLCSSGNELNDIMPTGSGVTAEEAIAACRAEPTCLSVESYQGRTDKWQFSSSCTRSIATPASNAVSYFRVERDGLMPVEGFVCSGRNELNNIMPTGSGVTAAEAVAACIAEPTCVQVESYAGRRDRWQFSSSCTPEIATESSNNLSYFRTCRDGTFDTTRVCRDMGQFCDEPERCLDCAHCDEHDRSQGKCPECVTAKTFLGVCIMYAQIFGSVDPQAQHHYSIDPNSSVFETLQAKMQLSQEQIDETRAEHPTIGDAKMSDFLDMYNAQVVFCVRTVGSLALEVAERVHPHSDDIMETAYFEWMETVESTLEVSTAGRRRLWIEAVLILGGIGLIILIIIVVYVAIRYGWSGVGKMFESAGKMLWEGRRELSMSNWESTEPTEEAMRRLLQAESANTGNNAFTIDLNSILNACKVSSVNMASWLCQQAEEELMHYMGLALCGGAFVETVCQVYLPGMEALVHDG